MYSTAPLSFLVLGLPKEIRQVPKYKMKDANHCTDLMAFLQGTEGYKQ